MVSPLNKQPVRRNWGVRIDPEAMLRLRREALRSRKTMGEWLEGAIDEKIDRERMKVR